MEFIDAKKYKRQIKNLYKSAFPKEERAPLFLLFKKAEAGKALFYAVLEDNEFIGLVYIITTKKLAYIFFLAVEEENRSKGYGSKILESVKKMYPEKTVILEIEDTEKEDAEKQCIIFFSRSCLSCRGNRRLHISRPQASRNSSGEHYRKSTCKE